MGKPTFDNWNSETMCDRVHSPPHEVFGRSPTTARRSRDAVVSDFQLSKEGMRLPNKIGGFKRTRVTETSQYPEERTSTETPLVVASERGPGQ